MAQSKNRKIQVMEIRAAEEMEKQEGKINAVTFVFPVLLEQHLEPLIQMD